MALQSKRSKLLELRAIALGYHVNGRNGTIEGIELATATAEAVADDALATNRVGLGITAAVGGTILAGPLALPLGLLALKKKDNRKLFVTLTAPDGRSMTREFSITQLDKIQKFVNAVNAQHR